jgi:hypothetical protein
MGVCVLPFVITFPGISTSVPSNYRIDTETAWSGKPVDSKAWQMSHTAADKPFLALWSPYFEYRPLETRNAGLLKTSADLQAERLNNRCESTSGKEIPTVNGKNDLSKCLLQKPAN